MLCECFLTSCCISPTNFKKPTISANIVGFLKFISEIQQLLRKRLRKNKLGINFGLHFTFYLSIVFFKILPHSATMKNTKKLLVFGENDSRCLSNFLQTHIFRKFDHISRTYNQINSRNIWFAKVIILLLMTTQVLFSDVFSKKDSHLNAVKLCKSW